MAGWRTSEEMARRRPKIVRKPKIDWAILSRRWCCFVWYFMPMELHSEQRARVSNQRPQCNDQTHAARQTNSKGTNDGAQQSRLAHSARIEILWRKECLDIRDWKTWQELPCERSIAERGRENCRVLVKNLWGWLCWSLQLAIYDR